MKAKHRDRPEMRTSEPMKAPSRETIVIAEEDLSRSVSAELFRAAFRLHAAGVAVVTADPGDGPVAMTVSSLASVSTEPPLLVFSVSARSSSSPALECAGTVVVHMLGADQLWLARLGATSGIDRFADASQWTRLPSGEPVFPAVHAWLRGRVVRRLEAGNSLICVVHVIEAHLFDSATDAGAVSPLVYHARTWHRLGGHSAMG
jgi:flavin reductase (DIM6/NTAB) family NADH-FMN oxidoreductase RutF